MMKRFARKKGGLTRSNLAKALVGFLIVKMLFMRTESMANVNNGKNRTDTVQLSDHVSEYRMILFTCKNGIQILDERRKNTVLNEVIL